MKSKIIMVVGLIFVFASITSQAQKNEKLIPFDMEQKTHSFSLPELVIDSVFTKNLNTILFDKNDLYMNNIISNPNNRWRHFHLGFEKIDTLHYCIVASLWDIPARISNGFYENNGYFYWYGGKVLPNIIVETKSKKRFSYKEPIPAPYDPPFWYLIYDIKRGCIEVQSITQNR